MYRTLSYHLIICANEYFNWKYNSNFDTCPHIIHIDYNKNYNRIIFFQEKCIVQEKYFAIRENSCKYIKKTMMNNGILVSSPRARF